MYCTPVFLAWRKFRLASRGKGEYFNISGVPLLLKNVIVTFFKRCYCYPEVYNTGTQTIVWSSIRVSVSGTSVHVFALHAKDTIKTS